MISSSPTSGPHVLVLHPDLDRLGGIEGYYRKVLPHFGVPVESFEVGRRHDDRSPWHGPFRPIADYLRLRRRLQRPDAPVVMFNPSLKLDMVVREGLMQRLAKANGRRTVVFWRGWDPALARRIDHHGRRMFRWLFGETDAFVVLAEEFKAALIRWGFRQPIHVEVTVIDDAALDGVVLESLLAERLQRTPRGILFLARLLRQKGLIATLSAVMLLRERPVELLVAGEGPELEPALRFVAEHDLKNVRFLGHVVGDRKWDLLRRASVLCLPTQHAEGLPNSVVEAMAFGLPVVTAPVGGVADFFRDGVHGFTVPARDPSAIAAAIGRLLDDEPLYRRVSLHNHGFARERFLASQAARRLEAIYRSVQNSEA